MRLGTLVLTTSVRSGTLGEPQYSVVAEFERPEVRYTLTDASSPFAETGWARWTRDGALQRTESRRCINWRYFAAPFVRVWRWVRGG